MAAPTMDELMALVGQPLDGPVVRTFIERHATEECPPDRQSDPERTLQDTTAGYEIRYGKGRRGKPDRVEVVFLYVQPRDGYEPFAGVLSGGLDREDSPPQVEAKLGPATRRGQSDKAGEWLWERRDTDRVCLHIAYGQGGVGLRMVTLMAPDVAPQMPKQPLLIE